jgi:hypothetical protein
MPQLLLLLLLEVARYGETNHLLLMLVARMGVATYVETMHFLVLVAPEGAAMQMETAAAADALYVVVFGLHILQPQELATHAGSCSAGCSTAADSNTAAAGSPNLRPAAAGSAAAGTENVLLLLLPVLLLPVLLLPVLLPALLLLLPLLLLGAQRQEVEVVLGLQAEEVGYHLGGVVVQR